MGKSLRFAISILITLSFSSANGTPAGLGGNMANIFSPTKGTGPAPSAARNEKAPSDHTSQKKGEFKQEADACDKDAKEAANQCDDKTSQPSQQAQGQADNYSQQQQQSGGSSAGGGQGGQGECGGLGDLMKALEPLMKQAGGQCKGANEKCKASCKKAQQGQSKCAGLPPDEMSKCQGDAQKNAQFGQKQEGNCGGMDANAAAFLQAAAMAAMQAMQMKKCKKDTELDCSKPENAEQEKCGGKKLLNCALPEFAADPKCICQQNPRAAGCPGSENPNDSSKVSKEKRDRSSPGSPEGSPSGPSSSTEQPLGKSSAAGLPSSPAGGAGGGKGLDATKGQELGGAAKGMSADVLAGDYGGGGAGGKVGGGGYPDGDPRAGALAKGKKATERRLASQGAWTGAMGRSNWDKIKERYRDNRPTLMNVER